MNDSMGFEPFIDYEELTDEMAAELHEKLGLHRKAMLAFLAEEPSKELAAQVLEAAENMDNAYKHIAQTLWTVPVMVHEAGPKKTETNPDDPTQEGIFQRCTRCGSVLSFWHEHMGVYGRDGDPRELEEEDMPWWKEGDTVAKTSNEKGMGMYLIKKGEELKKHERECVSLNSLVGD